MDSVSAFPLPDDHGFYTYLRQRAVKQGDWWMISLLVIDALLAVFLYVVITALEPNNSLLTYYVKIFSMRSEN